MLYIGIDLGTSAVKIILTNGKGTVLNKVSRSYPVNFPMPGYSEQDPRDWYIKTLDGINELIRDYDKTQIAGISFAGQMHGLVALDDCGNCIRPAILWNDGRAGKQSDYLNEVIGRAKLSEYTGNISFAGFTAPKLLWMKENEPDNYAKIRMILLPKDYLAYMFSGEYATDCSDASGTLYFDCRKRTWSKEMMDILGINEHMLPRVCESTDIIGNLSPRICELTGINPECKVIIGAGDNAAAAIGMGTVKDGDCNISLGTSGTIFVASDEFHTDDNNSLHAFDHASGKYHLMGCMLSAASCNKWWCDDILKNADYQKLQASIKDLGHNEVYFLPYLMGERSPINDASARAVFLGMNMNTSREDMYQAVLEGVCFALKDSMEAVSAMGIKVESASVCGGGARSKLWCKILANVLGIELTSTINDEGPALGAAMLAATACGEYGSIEEACAGIVKNITAVPEPELKDLYAERYLTFKRIYPALKEGKIW